MKRESNPRSRVQPEPPELKENCEQALKQEYSLSTVLLNFVDMVFIVLDSEGRIVRFNRACEECTGYSFAEVEGRFLWDFLLSADEIASVKSVFSRLELKEPSSRFECCWLTRDGHRRLIKWLNSITSDPDGLTKYIICSGIDVTEREKVEKDLKFRADFERLVSTISARFINLRSGDINRGIHAAMREVGEFTRVDRCNLFLFSDDFSEARMAAGWNREGVQLVQEVLPFVEMKPYQWILDKMKAREVVQFFRLTISLTNSTILKTY